MYNTDDKAPRPLQDTVAEDSERINILFIINDLKIGGAEKMLLYLISGLNKKVYRPVVCTLLDRGEYRHFLNAHGIKYYTLNMQNYFKIPFSLFKLVRIIRNEKISIIHSYLFYSDLMARISGFLTRTPIVITSMRNIDLWRKPYHIFIDSLTYGLSSAIISNSLAGATRLSNVEKIPAEKIKVVYNAIKLDEYIVSEKYSRASFRESLGAAPDDFVCVTVARLSEQKDHFTLLKTARHILNCYKNAAVKKIDENKLKFLIVGGGDLLDELKERSQKLGLDKNVIFLGERRDIKDILHACDIFLLTSVYEGIPNAILEAQACNVPVVATDVGGVSEIIEDNHNGVLCKPKDIEGISEKTRHMIENRNFAKTIAHNAMERLKEKFSCPNLISKTEAIYKNFMVQCAPEIAYKFFSGDEFKVKLNILFFITSSDVGGAQKHVMSLVKYFMEKGHQVRVATSDGEPMNSQLKKIGIMPVVLGKLQKAVNPLYDMITFYDISKLIVENSFHIIHCHSTKAGILGRLAAYFAGVPVKIFTAHGFVFHDKMNFFKKYLCVLAEKIGSIFGDGIITVSRADYLKALQYHVSPREKMKLIHNGIDCGEIEKVIEANAYKKSSLRAKYGIASDALVIGSVGRLVYEKSYSDAIRAFSMTAEKFKNTVMVIAGEGYEKKKIERTIKECGLEKRVILLGEISSIYELYSILDIFFLSSIKEGLPYSLLEAGCFALPCVCTDAGGISDVIKDGLTGILANSCGSKAFYDALLKTLELSPKQREDLGAALKKRITEEFSEARMLSETEKFYISLTNKKGLI